MLHHYYSFIIRLRVIIILLSLNFKAMKYIFYLLQQEQMLSHIKILTLIGSPHVSRSFEKGRGVKGIIVIQFYYKNTGTFMILFQDYNADVHVYIFWEVFIFLFVGLVLFIEEFEKMLPDLKTKFCSAFI